MILRDLTGQHSIMNSVKTSFLAEDKVLSHSQLLSRSRAYSDDRRERVIFTTRSLRIRLRELFHPTTMSRWSGAAGGERRSTPTGESC